MKILFRLSILFVPMSLIIFLFVYLKEDKFYPGADFRNFNTPAFELPLLDKVNIVTNKDLGDEYILNIWASWCITCLVEHPYLTQLKSKKIPIVGLNYKDEKNEAINWLQKFGNPYELIIYDYKGQFALDLGVTGAPETFLIHNDRVLVHYQGEVNEKVWKDVFKPIIEKEGLFND